MVVVEKPDVELRIWFDPMYVKKENITSSQHLRKLQADWVEPKSLPRYMQTKGYWQIPSDENSIKLTTVNTPFGWYKFTRLSYGMYLTQAVVHKSISQSFDGILQIETEIYILI